MAVFVALFAVALAPPPHDYAHLEAVLQAKDEQIAALTSQLAWRGPEKKPAEPVAQVALGAKPAAPRAELAGAPQVGLDHYISAANFKVEVDGHQVENSKIVSVKGIVSESEDLNITHGDDRYIMHQPGRAFFHEVELTRVYNQVDAFYLWRLQIEQGVVARKTVTVSALLPDKLTVARKMLLHECYPRRWAFPEFDAANTGPAIEKITLSCSWFTAGK